jgi:hypothetical protein
VITKEWATGALQNFSKAFSFTDADKLVEDPRSLQRQKNIPAMLAIQGSSLYHEVSTTGKTKVKDDRAIYDLITANKPCRCHFFTGISSTGACIMMDWKDSTTC